MKKGVFVLTIGFLFVSAHPVSAYLDPGSGSYIIQVLIGAVLGGAYLIKNFWKNIVSSTKNFFKKLQKTR